jgi:hypothetical protein
MEIENNKHEYIPHYVLHLKTKDILTLTFGSNEVKCFIKNVKDFIKSEDLDYRIQISLKFEGDIFRTESDLTQNFNNIKVGEYNSYFKIFIIDDDFILNFNIESDYIDDCDYDDLGDY